MNKKLQHFIQYQGKYSHKLLPEFKDIFDKTLGSQETDSLEF